MLNFSAYYFVLISGSNNYLQKYILDKYSKIKGYYILSSNYGPKFKIPAVSI